MARSIESFDMFSWRAEMIAARNRAFMLGSGWPIFAATVISRASFENSFDFWASCRPLRCMMFLNWECPAMRSLSGFVRDEMGWKARRYRPRPGQNQRFAPDFLSPPRVAPRARARRNRGPPVAQLGSPGPADDRARPRLLCGRP